MTDQKEHKVDRTGWGSGPWDDEPDRIEWRAHGLPCLIVRNDHGSLCGYVGVPPGHHAHGKPHGAVDVDVHGGLTYADGCFAQICHVPEPGEPDDVWWLGFDCGHAFDVQPGLEALLESVKMQHGVVGWGGTYRPVNYVRAEVERLALQLAAVDSPVTADLEPTKG